MGTRDPMDEAEAAAKRKDWSQAADLLANADTGDAWSARAFYLSRAERYHEAIELLERLRAREPRSARVLYMIGFQYAQREEWNDAIAWLERALELAPDYLKAHYRLAQAHHRAGHQVPAQIAAGKVVQFWHGGDEDLKKREGSKFARACHLLAKLQLRRDPDGAVDLMRQAVEHEPNDPYHRYLLGKALTRAGRPEEAIEPLRKAKQIEPRKSFIDLELIRALLETGGKAEAEERLHRVARHCHGWDAYNGGRLALRLDDGELARELLERAGRRGPSRGSSVVEDQLRSLSPTPKSTPSDKTDADQPSGEIVYLNSKRHFGFLVDQNGVKRHFRVQREGGLHKGGQVTFAPAEKEKGPAAEHVRIAS